MTGLSSGGDASGNGVLDALAVANRERLFRVGQRVDLQYHDYLYRSEEQIDNVYFPIDGVMSIVAVLESGTIVEVATVGREGMIGLPVYLGSYRSVLEAVCQVPGEAFRVPSRAFQQELARAAELSSVLARYTQAFYTQLGISAACNTIHTARQRMARWLLMVHDRTRADRYLLTQEVLAEMLGVRRQTVGRIALHFQERGFLRYKRGRMAIVDRQGLEAEACECYSIMTSEYRNLMVINR